MCQVCKLCFMSESLNNIDIQVFFVNSERDLLVAFVNFTLSQLYNHYTRNCIFLLIFGNSCLVRKMFSKSSHICVFILPKNSTAFPTLQ